MGGCCVAVGCKSSSAKGNSLKIFPKDPARRAIWEARVRRLGWKPSKTSRLCEKHFDDSQWEKIRQDGKRKLKWNAVPTIFSHRKPVKLRKPPLRREFIPPTPKKPKAVKKVDKPSEHPPQQHITTEQLYIVEEIDSTPQESASAANLSGFANHTEKDQSVELLKSEIFNYRKRLGVMERQLTVLRRHLSTNRVEKHRVNKRSEMFESNIKKLFNEDQLKALESSSMRFNKWSDDTIAMALRLQISCGLDGYRNLIKLHYPLPSIRTLRRKLVNLKDATVVCDGGGGGGLTDSTRGTDVAQGMDLTQGTDVTQARPTDLTQLISFPIVQY